MPRPTGPTDFRVRLLVRRLKKLSRETGKAIWKRVALELLKPRRQRAEVNLYKIEKYANPGDIVVVPGKVLGDGELSKPVTIIALAASQQALEKIKAAGAQFISLFDISGEEIKGKRVWLMK
ncbi:MAG: 50S ribosomal protein L18e [bacterium]|nr:50S ribosomal protein L18e [bacterium]